MSAEERAGGVWGRERGRVVWVGMGWMNKEFKDEQFWVKIFTSAFGQAEGANPLTVTA